MYLDENDHLNRLQFNNIISKHNMQRNYISVGRQDTQNDAALE